MEVCPFSVADTLHVPASGSFRTHEPPAAVPVTVLPLFVAVTAAPDVTETTRDNYTHAADNAFVFQIMFYTALMHKIDCSVIAAAGFDAA